MIYNKQILKGDIFTFEIEKNNIIKCISGI